MFEVRYFLYATTEASYARVATKAQAEFMVAKLASQGFKAWII